MGVFDLGKNIGIDFGTTNTVISFRRSDGKIKKCGDGGKSIRTAVFFKSRNECLIGQEAIDEGYRYPKALAVNFKPRIKGDKYSITAADGDEFELKPAAIAKIFLNNALNKFVTKRMNKEFGDIEFRNEDRVVVTVPIKFNPEEKKAVKKAAEKANFPNVSIAFEPTAAAVAVADMNSSNEEEENIAVYDFGGGTFDVSVIQKKKNGVYVPLEKGQGGDKNLGGNNICKKVIEDFILPELEDNDIYLSLDTDDEDFEFDPDDYSTGDYEPEENEYLYNWIIAKSMAEDVKESFSNDDASETEEFTYNFHKNGSEYPLEFKISKTDYDNSIRSFIERTVSITEKVINETESFHGAEIKRIVLAGGSSQIKLCRELLCEKFEDRGIEVVCDVNIFDVISKGALILCENEKDLNIEERTVSQFGIDEKKGGMYVVFAPLIMEGAKLPVSGERDFEIGDQTSGEIRVRLYEKDVKNYPDASRINRDEGISEINEYRIPIPQSDHKLKNVKVIFTIEKDGTLKLTADFIDEEGSVVKKVEVDMDSDSNLE